MILRTYMITLKFSVRGRRYRLLYVLGKSASLSARRYSKPCCDQQTESHFQREILYAQQNSIFDGSVCQRYLFDIKQNADNRKYSSIHEQVKLGAIASSFFPTGLDQISNIKRLNQIPEITKSSSLSLIFVSSTQPGGSDPSSKV